MDRGYAIYSSDKSSEELVEFFSLKLAIEVGVEDVHQAMDSRGGHFAKSESNLEVVEKVDQFSETDASRAIEVEVVEVSLCQTSEFLIGDSQSAVVAESSELGGRREDIDAKSTGDAALSHLLAGFFCRLSFSSCFGFPDIWGEVGLGWWLVEGLLVGVARELEEAEVWNLGNGLGGTEVLVALRSMDGVGGWRKRLGLLGMRVGMSVEVGGGLELRRVA